MSVPLLEFGKVKLLVTQPVAQAVAALIFRESPLSHDDLDLAFRRAHLGHLDPGRQDAAGMIGKHRRVKTVLTEAVDTASEAGGDLVVYLLQRLVGAGCFRAGSADCIPSELVENARGALQAEGFELHTDGTLSPLSLETLSGRELTDALRVYVDRARRGATDAALLAGTGKDLLEAVARHALVEQTQTDNVHMPFPGTLLHAFQALSIVIDDGRVMKAQQALSVDPMQQLHEALYLLGVAVNNLRNSQGTGHGRPFPVSLSPRDAAVAVEATGLVAELLLGRLASAAHV